MKSRRSFIFTLIRLPEQQLYASMCVAFVKEIKGKSMKLLRMLLCAVLLVGVSQLEAGWPKWMVCGGSPSNVAEMRGVPKQRRGSRSPSPVVKTNPMRGATHIQDVRVVPKGEMDYVGDLTTAEMERAAQGTDVLYREIGTGPKSARAVKYAEERAARDAKRAEKARSRVAKRAETSRGASKSASQAMDDSTVASVVSFDDPADRLQHIIDAKAQAEALEITTLA